MKNSPGTFKKPTRFFKGSQCKKRARIFYIPYNKMGLLKIVVFTKSPLRNSKVS